MTSQGKMMSFGDTIANQLLNNYSKAYTQGQLKEYEYAFIECRKAVELILLTLFILKLAL